MYVLSYCIVPITPPSPLTPSRKKAIDYSRNPVNLTHIYNSPFTNHVIICNSNLDRQSFCAYAQTPSSFIPQLHMRDRCVANTFSLCFLRINSSRTIRTLDSPNPQPPSPFNSTCIIYIYIYIQSQAVLTPSLIFVSGQIPHRPTSSPSLAQSASISEKTAACIANVSAILEAAGSSLDKVVKTTVFLTDMERDFKEMNEEYSKHFTGGERGVRPARSCVEVRKLPLGVEVEIECLALRD